MQHLRAAAVVALSTAMLGCAAQVEYVEYGTVPRHRPAREPSQVEVLTQLRPAWDYRVAGYFQEAARDSVPGGRRSLAVLLRHRAAALGCDGVIIEGNTSRFDGRYEYVTPWRRRWNDGSRRGGGWFPVWEHQGVSAECVVRTEPVPRAEPPADDEADVPTSYPTFFGTKSRF
jgi:hypothetical protein